MTFAKQVNFGPPPSNWCWADLEPDTAADVLERLATWVGWFRGRYPVAEQVPLCWWRHPELVEELTALWLAWTGLYLDPAAPLTGPIEFHDRWLPGVLARIRGWGVHCDATHRDRADGTYDPRAVDDPTAFAGLTAVTTHPNHTEETVNAVLTIQDMTELCQQGLARSIGDFDLAPVTYDHSFWILVGDAFVRVTDQALAAQLTDDERRLRLADEAVACTAGDLT